MFPEEGSKPGLSRKLLAVEWLKSELLSETGNLFRSLVTGTQETVIESLAGILISAYVLALRLGINPAMLEHRMMGRLARSIQNKQEMEVWFGDLSKLHRHLSKREDKS